MKDALRAAGVVALIVFVLVPGAAFAGNPTVPELDPSLGVAGLVLMGGATAFLIERYRRRTK